MLKDASYVSHAPRFALPDSERGCWHDAEQPPNNAHGDLAVSIFPLEVFSIGRDGVA
jgi:hypothetical protein